MALCSTEEATPLRPAAAAPPRPCCGARAKRGRRGTAHARRITTKGIPAHHASMSHCPVPPCARVPPPVQACAVVVASGARRFLKQRFHFLPVQVGGGLGSPLNYDSARYDSIGSELRVLMIPVVYYDGSLLGAFYLVDAAAAARVLPRGVAPLVLPLVGKAVAVVLCTDVRDSTIGRYKEAGVAVYARRPGLWCCCVGWVGVVWDMALHALHAP
eukprot:gene30976-32731_t